MGSRKCRKWGSEQGYDGKDNQRWLCLENGVYVIDLTVSNRSYIEKYQIPLDLFRKIVTFLSGVYKIESLLFPPLPFIFFPMRQ